MRFFLILIQLSLISTIYVCSVTAKENITSSKKEINPDQQARDIEAGLLEETHYSNADFLRIYKSLPRDDDNKVDWELAVKNGLIDPVASINGNEGKENIFDLSVVIKFNDMLIKDVIFSHEIHTYWLDCNSCHPKIFLPQVAANRMTMEEIQDGKYCGKCHGMVAFPAKIIEGHNNFRANCLRCHRAKR